MEQTQTGYKSLKKLAVLPGVNSAVTITTSLYEKLKKKNAIIRASFDLAEISFQTFNNLIALPLVEMLVANDKYFNDSQRQKLGFNLTQSLYSCKFNARLCNINDFHYVYNYKYGNCFQFNHDMKTIFSNLNKLFTFFLKITL